MSETRWCLRCGIRKPLNHFNPDPSKPKRQVENNCLQCLGRKRCRMCKSVRTPNDFQTRQGSVSDLCVTCRAVKSEQKRQRRSEQVVEWYRKKRKEGAS
jgi:hypothetical protein